MKRVTGRTPCERSRWTSTQVPDKTTRAALKRLSDLFDASQGSAAGTVADDPKADE
jgi:hypothetical protein